MTVTFAAVLYRLLIKKGRGIWPVDALATTSMQIETGANSIPVVKPGKISQIYSFYIVSANNIFKSSSDLPGGFFCFYNAMKHHNGTRFPS